MGIYDRDYYRPQQPGLAMRMPGTMVGRLILINVAIYVIDSLFFNHQIENLMAVQVGALAKPWLWWQFLTYGFAHSVQPEHILFNMLGLWFLGRDIEQTYGSKEFLRLYLATLVVGSVAWAGVNTLMHTPAAQAMLGASGAVAGVVVLYALHFPRRTLLLFFVLPVPAWFVGVLLVAGDMFGALGGQGETNIAYSVHLAGAGFAFLYYRFGWNFGRLLEGRFSMPKLRRGPKLRIHDPEEDPPRAQPDSLSQEVDRILEKIHKQGEASLSRKERRTLEEASRRYQEQRKT